MFVRTERDGDQVARQQTDKPEPVKRRAMKEHFLLADPDEPVALAFIVPDQLSLVDFDILRRVAGCHILCHCHLSWAALYTTPVTALSRSGYHSGPEDITPGVTGTTKFASTPMVKHAVR